jgi:phosphoribosylformylglycinamidine cyclo-ligase
VERWVKSQFAGKYLYQTEYNVLIRQMQTAEMPGFYADGEYDLAGFAVGSVQKDKVIDGSRITAGDVVLGLPSSGVHSNGFSLVRKVLEKSGGSLNDIAPWSGQSFGMTLLTPTAIYVSAVLDLIEKVQVKVSNYTSSIIHYLCLL